MEAIGSPNCALLFGQRRLWVRVDVQASADRKGPAQTARDPYHRFWRLSRRIWPAAEAQGLIAMWGAHAASASR